MQEVIGSIRVFLEALHNHYRRTQHSDDLLNPLIVCPRLSEGNQITLPLRKPSQTWSVIGWPVTFETITQQSQSESGKEKSSLLGFEPLMRHCNLFTATSAALTLLMELMLARPDGLFLETRTSSGERHYWCSCTSGAESRRGHAVGDWCYPGFAECEMQHYKFDSKIAWVRFNSIGNYYKLNSKMYY